MNIVEAMERRHAVRDFSDRPIDDDTLRALNEAVDAANADGGLDVQLVQDDTDAFGGCPTHYGRFKNVRYCIALIGSDDEDPAQLDRKVGYYGERLALTATQLGMDSSWVVLHETHDHNGRWRLGEGERMPAALALGYGDRPGRAHRSKPLEELGAVENGDLSGAPDWFLSGLRAVALAPSALGKQPVRFTLLEDGKTVLAQPLEGVQADICLGIARYHFEVGSGHTDIVVR
ncbi:nitroreductase family protein [Bifidobacterium bifidum]|uniref:nitroreductase family protein n=1 Tax=Bifidobacterium bifidum TaxID=1681 RepID=UPI0012AB57F6|nr:nitroreductase family protein [Bifidobacterium bifidum]